MTQSIPNEVTEEAAKALFLYAEADIDEERITEKLGDYAPLFVMTRSESFRPLGETPPASAFNADWE